MLAHSHFTEKQNYPFRETIIYKLGPSEIHNFFRDIPNIISKMHSLRELLFLK